MEKISGKNGLGTGVYSILGIVTHLLCQIFSGLFSPFSFLSFTLGHLESTISLGTRTRGALGLGFRTVDCDLSSQGKILPDNAITPHLYSCTKIAPTPLRYASSHTMYRA